MRLSSFVFSTVAMTSLTATSLFGQTFGPRPTDTLTDPIRILVSRLNLDSYKNTIKGLTQFGDRRQGTKRNRDAVDWIEAQLKSYGCPTGRIVYQYNPAPRNPAGRGGGRGRGARPPSNIASGGGRYRGIRAHRCE